MIATTLPGLRVAGAQLSLLSGESKSWHRILQVLIARLCGVMTELRGSRRIESVDDCMFCQKDDPALNRIFAQNRYFFARYDNYPATPGHIELVPKRHVVSYFHLTRMEILAAYALLLESRRKLAKLYSPDGYTIGINEGTASGRSIDHLHIHVIPRYRGDVSDPRGGIRQVVPNWDPDSWNDPLKKD